MNKMLTFIVKKNMKQFFLMILFLSFEARASIKSKKNELYRYRMESLELGARLKTLEKEINYKQNLYQSSIQNIDKLSQDLILYQKSLKKKKDEVQLTLEQNKLIIKSYLIESETEIEDQWEYKVHQNLLKQSQEKLKKSKKELDELNLKVVSFQQKIDGLKKDEVELSSIIKEMQLNIHSLEKNYHAKIEKRKEVEREVKKFRKKVILKRIKKRVAQISGHQLKPERVFLRPISQIISVKPSLKKGVTFKFKGHQAIKAVGDGRIVFAGDLASYGQVIMIDHGNELRTVLLGKMGIKVKKNDLVKSGDEIAHTMSQTASEETLYFEVRKKNTAQKTIKWLELNGVQVI